MVEIDQDDLVVLEAIQPVATLLQRRGAGEGRRESLADRLLLAPPITSGLQDRQERLVLQADEVLPQEIAGSEQACEVLHQSRIGQVDGARVLGDLQKALDELLESRQRGVRIGRPVEEVRELLRQQGAEPDALKGVVVVDLVAVFVEEIDDVANTAFDGSDVHVLDRAPLQGQRAADRVQEGGGVLR